MLTWQYITQNDYGNMNEELKTADKLFFIKDTKKIFENLIGLAIR